MPTDAADGWRASAGSPSIALVHDHIVQRGGGERVLLGMHKAFPGAPVYTSFYRPDMTFPDFAAVDVRPMAVNRVRAVREHHRAVLPLFPVLFDRLHVDADVAICSSSGWAQGARVRGRKIVFFQAVAQWLYSTGDYLGRERPGRRLAAAGLRPWLARWDRRTTATADRILVCGPTMQARVHEVYGADADIVPPVVPVDPTGPERAVDRVEPGYFLCASRLVPSKNVDAVIGAFAGLPDDLLVIAGDGPERRRLEHGAPANVRFLGDAEDDQMRWLYRNCQAVVTAGVEAYGLTPVEAAAFGKPSIALAAAGLLDTVRDGQTGVLFDRADATVIRAAVQRFSPACAQAGELVELARRHTLDAFAGALRRIVEEEVAR